MIIKIKKIFLRIVIIINKNKNKYVRNKYRKFKIYTCNIKVFFAHRWVLIKRFSIENKNIMK